MDATSTITTIDQAISRAATGPKSVTIEGQSTALPSIDELIRADQYQAAKKAAANPAASIRQIKLESRY